MGFVKPVDGYEFRTAHGKCDGCGAVGFHTKNIGGFGSRTIYDFPGGCGWMKARNNASQCECKRLILNIDQDAHDHVAHCDECKQYGY